MGVVRVGQPGLFDLDERYAALSKRGDPLERLAAVEDFEMYRAGAGELAEEAIVSKEARVTERLTASRESRPH
jgi:hypothetical protein